MRRLETFAIVAALCCAGCEPGRPSDVPPGAEYTGNAVWDGRWVWCESWEVGAVTRCAMRKGGDFEEGEYVIDSASAHARRQLEARGDERLRPFFAGTLYSGLHDSDLLADRGVQVVPLVSRRRRSDGVRVASVIAESYRDLWRHREIAAFAVACLRTVETPLETRLPALLREADVEADDISIRDARRTEGSLDDQAEVLIEERAYSIQVVGDCWIRVVGPQ